MPDVLIPFLLVGPILLLLALGIVTILIREQRRRLVQEQEKQQILSQQNEQLEQQVAARTAELMAQRNDLEQALADLKTTQTQLVQREKMASLGELTAGIAHEMQNPLNFVTNFSDLSVDLVAELEEELAKEPLSENGQHNIQVILQELIQNQSRIHEHGHRADRIVKSMLEHSRTNSSQLQPTNINNLVEESLRLAYHGWRAKNKESNATLLTELDPALEPIPVLPQDLSRVFLNLLTNAFYAVAEKDRQQLKAYCPEVCVKTQKVGNMVEVRVRDNGNGIPLAMRDKIFQPFFTTKPTGEGTGLGLSLSYDIITKGHGGTLNVESKEGEYTEFTICLPADVKKQFA